MSIIKTLLESSHHIVSFETHNNIPNNRVSRQGKIVYSFEKLNSWFGEPHISTNPNEDSYVEWHMTVTTSEREYPITIYSDFDLEYKQSTSPYDIDVWYIGAKSGWDAWELQTMLNSPHISSVNIKHN